MQFRTNPVGSVTEIPPTHCPNGHELRYPNVISGYWPKPGTGKMVRAWHCLTCKETIYDEQDRRGRPPCGCSGRGAAPASSSCARRDPLLANTDDQAVVADMLRMRAQEKTDNWIATYLNQNAVPGKGGGVGGWQANTLANVLRVGSRTRSGPMATQPDPTGAVLAGDRVHRANGRLVIA